MEIECDLGRAAADFHICLSERKEGKQASTCLAIGQEVVGFLTTGSETEVKHWKELHHLQSSSAMGDAAFEQPLEFSVGIISVTAPEKKYFDTVYFLVPYIAYIILL